MKSIRFIIGTLISAAFVYLILRAVDIGKVLQAMKEVDWRWLPLAIVIYFIAIWFRTTRWALLMKPITQCTTHRLFPIYVISYMANNILPLRIGDLYRAYIVGKKESVSKGASLVTIGVERIFDGLTMLVLLFLAVMFFPIEHPQVKLAIQISAVIFLTALLVCYLVVLNKKWMRWIFDRILSIPVLERFHPKLTEIFENVFKGLDSLRGAKDILLVAIYSLFTWLLEAASYMVVLWAFGFNGGFHVAVSAMAFVNLFIIVPAAPGYFGPFEAACIIILGNSGYGSVTHFTENIAAAYALVLHVVIQWLPSTLLGLYYMWSEHLSFKEIQVDSDDASVNER